MDGVYICILILFKCSLSTNLEGKENVAIKECPARGSKEDSVELMEISSRDPQGSFLIFRKKVKPLLRTGKACLDFQHTRQMHCFGSIVRSRSPVGHGCWPATTGLLSNQQ
eukprot:c18199_g1_i1 orf=944-1276(-)